jgi:formamidopyrimidine-DNA glycosylase
VRLKSPSLLRTWDPPPSAVHGKRVLGFRRIGKRVVGSSRTTSFLVFHLMVTAASTCGSRAPRSPRRTRTPRSTSTTARCCSPRPGTQKKASLHVIRGEAALAELDPAGSSRWRRTSRRSARRSLREDRTLKRALTDPRILSGIGNAHSDEILHQAGSRPCAAPPARRREIERLHRVTVAILSAWTERLRGEPATAFPRR